MGTIVLVEKREIMYRDALNEALKEEMTAMKRFLLWVKASLNAEVHIK